MKHDVITVRTKQDYTRATAVMDQVLDDVGEDENHPLVDVLDYLSHQVIAYEADQVEIPNALPRDVLHFLMQQHNLSQIDLADCAPPKPDFRNSEWTERNQQGFGQIAGEEAWCECLRLKEIIKR